MRNLGVLGLDKDVRHRGRPRLSEQGPLGQWLPQNQEGGGHSTSKARGRGGASGLEGCCPGQGACPPRSVSFTARGLRQRRDVLDVGYDMHSSLA